MSTQMQLGNAMLALTSLWDILLDMGFLAGLV